MNKDWSDDAWDDYEYWQNKTDAQLRKSINFSKIMNVTAFLKAKANQSS